MTGIALHYLLVGALDVGDLLSTAGARVELLGWHLSRQVGGAAIWGAVLWGARR